MLPSIRSFSIKGTISKSLLSSLSFSLNVFVHKIAPPHSVLKLPQVIVKTNFFINKSLVDERNTIADLYVKL